MMVRSALTGLLVLAIGCKGKESAASADTNTSATQPRIAVTPTTPPIDPTLWLTSAPGHTADFDSTTSRAKLVERFGAENVVEDSVQYADAEPVLGTILFPKDSTRRLEIVWVDPKTRTRPERVDLRGESGRWAVAPGIRLGMRLKDLERINGGSFTIMGFDWDYGGTVTNWRRGQLARPESEMPRVFIRLAPFDTDTGAIRNTVSGDRQFNSKKPEMQELNPRVVGISVSYRLPKK